MKYAECVSLVFDTYRTIQASSQAAVDVTTMIIAHESGQGKHRRQIGAANPALGLGQMERETFDTCRMFGDRYKTYLKRAGYDPESVKFEDLEHDDVLAVVLIRVRLAMDRNSLPLSPREQAEFCKKFWNAGGKASADKYLNDWERWKNDTQ